MSTTPKAQATAQLVEFVTLLKRKKQWLIYPPAIGLVVAMIVTALLPKQFESGTLLEIKEVVLLADPTVSDPRDHPILRNLPNVGSQIQDFNLIARVVGQELQWPQYAAVAASGDAYLVRQYLQQIADRVIVGVAQKKAATGDDRISIAFRDHDPERARSFVEALSAMWRQQVRDSYIRILEDQYAQRKRVLDQLENERTTTSGLIDRIVTEGQLPIAAGEFDTDHQSSSVDPEEVKLAARKEELRLLEGKLVTLLPQLEIARARLDELEPLEDVEFSETIEETLSPSVLALRAELESEKFAYEQEIDGKTDVSPQVQYVKRKIARIDQQLAELGGSTSEAQPTKWITRPNEVWKAQKALVDSLNAEYVRDTATKDLLTEQVRTLGRTVSERSTSYTQVRLAKQRYHELGTEIATAKAETEARSQVLRLLKSERGDPFGVLVPPIAGRTPVWPNTWLLLGVGILVGLIFGATMVLLTEYGRLSFRSVEDAASSLEIPVLGAVNRIFTVEELRRKKVSRVFSLSIALMFIGAIGSFVYLYTRHPDRLPQSLTRVLDDLIGGRS